MACLGLISMGIVIVLLLCEGSCCILLCGVYVWCMIYGLWYIIISGVIVVHTFLNAVLRDSLIVNRACPAFPSTVKRLWGSVSILVLPKTVRKSGGN